MSQVLSEYFELRDRVTQSAERLFIRYESHIECRRGCYYCCDEITVLPIEIEAARRWIAEFGAPATSRLGGPPDDAGETPQAVAERDRRYRQSHDRSRFGAHPNPVEPARRCGLLGNSGECTVYGGRPLICRTHGLPLAYRVYEYDQKGREINPDQPDYFDLWCDLNFTTATGRSLVDQLAEDDRINMHLINIELDELNARFLADRRQHGGTASSKTDRLPMIAALRARG